MIVVVAPVVPFVEALEYVWHNIYRIVLVGADGSWSRGPTRFG